MDYDQTIKKTRPWEVLFSAGTKALEDGEFQEAEEYLKKAYDQVIRYGTEDPRIALISGSLSEVYSKLHRYDQAETYCKISIEVIERSLGSDYSSLIKIRENYADLLRKMKRTEEAEKMSLEAKKIKKRYENPGWHKD